MITLLELNLAQDIESLKKRSRSSAVFFGECIVKEGLKVV